MSLINDALKEAKQAQQEAAPQPTPNLQLRPIEHAQQTRGSTGLIWPTALLAIALLLLVMLWQQNRRTDGALPTEVKARTAMVSLPAAPPVPAPTPVSAAPEPEAVLEPAPAPAPAAKTTPRDGLEIAAVPLSLDSPTAAPLDGPTTNAVAVAAAPSPKPVLPKLQGILFSSTRPCAMISGKTVFIGDKLEGLLVVAISQETVTLTGTGQTNVLSLAR